jgi:tRNA(adenine34) deaminase
LTRLDETFMAVAMKEAEKAARKGEVPVGAVIVHEGAVIARGHNKRELANDPAAHAEFLAIRAAAKKLGRWRLSGTTLYVTLEPCLMCMGAIILARVPRLVFGAFDPKAGACGSLYDISEDKRLNHRVHVTSGVLGIESQEALKGFFRRLRAEKKEKKGS